MKISSVIFDLDGTLTAPILDFTQIRKEMGIDSKSLDTLAMMDQMTPEQREQAERILERHEQYAAEHSQLNNGVECLLSELRKRKLFIGLLTRNTRKNILTVVRRHHLEFDGIVDRDDGPAKPNAYGVHRLCELFKTQPAETLVVGDFLHDLQCAHNAGAISVLIRTHPNAQQYESQADHIIDSLIEVLNVIDKLENTLTEDAK